jgi:Na+-transporting NADH:ubiquinone oxidoreductase subunit A
MKEKKIRMTRGLNIPLGGGPVQEVRGEKRPKTVALLGDDHIGMKPRLEVSVGDRVKLGQVLFTDRAMPSVRYTAPGAGIITAINRGERRKLLSVVIRLEGDDEISFSSHAEHLLPTLDRKTAAALLLESGLWPVLRTRPFNRTPVPETEPHSIFITAIDTNPLAPSIEKVLEGRERDFVNGLAVLSRLTEGKLFLCKAPGETVPLQEMKSLSVIEFSGPHPAGNAGTHIHFLDPVNRKKAVWHVQAADAADIGALFTTGRIPVERVAALAGPSVRNPRLIRTRIGASLEDIVSGELQGGNHRIISGSVLSGRAASEGTSFLGRYHRQISVIPEAGNGTLPGWLRPGLDLYSANHVVLTRFLPKRTIALSASSHGPTTALYPIGSYEKVMPLDIMATFLLRALAVDDLDEAESLGCLELDEEDLALSSFVCPSKIDHGANLRRVLTLIEKEG